MSALGQKQTYAVQQAMSALPPIATAKADMPQMVMSALSPKVDMCGATSNVGYGPKGDTAADSVTPSDKIHHGAAGRVRSRADFVSLDAATARRKRNKRSPASTPTVVATNVGRKPRT